MKSEKEKKFKALPMIIIGVIALLLGTFYLFNKGDKSDGIPISMALDDGYIYPTIVAMTSILENANSETKYDFYIMHPKGFSEENQSKLKSLEKKYENCRIKLINMGDKYKNANDKGHITTPAYYRLSLSELIPERKKIIWLDGDTITHGDLKEMYDIDMNGYYYKGFLDDYVSGVKEFAPENDHCICSGVMLINLEELRKDDMVKKFSKFIEKNNDKLIQHDQTTINAVAYKKVGILPAKYGIYNYWSTEDAISKSEFYISKDGYSKEELESAYTKPLILHCVNKPWKNMEVYGGKTWWDYACKTDFYNEIHEKYPIF